MPSPIQAQQLGMGTLQSPPLSDCGIPMALKATIHKAELQLSDLDRQHYGSYSLTLARHPSETDERMMVRLLAFALYASEYLSFCKGISDEDEPDLWEQDLGGNLERWIEVGLPDEKRIRKACGRARQVVVITYSGRTADMWWQQNQAALAKQEKLTVLQLPAPQSQALAALAERTMNLSCTIQEGQIWLSSGQGDLQLEPRCLQRPD